MERFQISLAISGIVQDAIFFMKMTLESVVFPEASTLEQIWRTAPGKCFLFSFS
jgi:hypothetical protein